MNILITWNLLLILEIFPKYTITADDSDAVIRGNDYLTEMFDKMMDYEPMLKTKSSKGTKLKFLRDGVFLDGWNLYKHLNKKEYESQHIEDERKSIFYNNLKKIKKHNMQEDKTFRMGVNKFADFKKKEFIIAHTCVNCVGKKIPTRKPQIQPLSLPTNIPENYDARKYGYVSHPRSQSTCGSCYAHSALFILEAHIAKRTKRRVTLSAQQIVDCAFKYRTCGCHGGDVFDVFDYIRDHGIIQDRIYGYTNYGKACTAEPVKKSEIVVKGHKRIDNDENEILLALLKYGPVAVAMNAEAWQHYKSGILNLKNCSNFAGHGVTVFGYGVESNTDYWIVQNSWGTNWGEKGFGRFVRNKYMCGFGQLASVPIL